MIRERKAQAYAQALGLRYLKVKSCLDKIRSDVQEQLQKAIEKVDNRLIELGVSPDKPETWKVLSQEVLYDLADVVWEINEKIEDALEMEKKVSIQFINFIEPKLDHLAAQGRATIKETMAYLQRFCASCI